MTALIDTHQHLIYPDIGSYGWTNDIEQLANKAFPLAAYQNLTAGTDIKGSLFMEAAIDDKDYQGETRFVAGLSKNPNSSILGIIASCRPETDKGFSGWLDECMSLNVVGFRRILHVVDDAMSTSATFRANVRAIGNRGKVFDMCFLARQLPIALELAKACDNTIMVVDHCGVPDIAGDGLDPWRNDMRSLAALPNVMCKLSGILAYCALGKANLASISPYVDHVLEVFGPRRIVWGSDWPVVDMANGLADWIGVTQQILGQLSDDEALAIGSENAVRIYKINLA